MSQIDQDEIGVPYTEEDALAENIDRIRTYHQNGNAYLSTSQQIMVGLALCRPDLLEQANYPSADIKSAWGRLNDPQRQAIIAWWQK